MSKSSCKSACDAIDFLKWKSPNYILLTLITGSVSVAVDVTIPILAHNLIMVFVVISKTRVEILSHTQHIM